jgi:hypothetical protein
MSSMIWLLSGSAKYSSAVILVLILGCATIVSYPRRVCACDYSANGDGFG